MIQNSNENEDLSESEHEQVLHRDLNRLNKMVGYCKTTRCLRSYILEYFGEQQIEPCGNCGNCKSQYIQRNITTEAQKILSAVARVERKYPYGLGESLIVQMLHGSDIKRISQLGLNKFSTYGIMRDVDQRKIHDYIDFLISKGYLELTQTKYPVLRLTDHSKEILFQGIQVTLKEKAAKRWKDSHSTEEKASLSLTRFESDESSLYEALRALRTKISRAENVPAYVVFSNATLSDMAMKCPHNMVDFLEVSGVGETKAKRYGMQFLNTIKSWEDGGSQNG